MNFHSLAIYVILLALVGCSVFQKNPPKQFLYRGYCQHTQTISNITLYEDSTYVWIYGEFLGSGYEKGVYKILSDTVLLSPSKSPSHQYTAAMTIDDYAINQFGNNDHNHVFKFQCDSCK